MKRERARPRRRRAVGLLIAAVAGLVLLDPSALRLGNEGDPADLVSEASAAHVTLRRSSPSAGDSLAGPPVLLRLEFTDDVELALSRLALLGAPPDSAQVALSPLRRDGGDPRTIVADVAGPMPAGRYAVRWTIAGRDGHPVRGEFFFVIAPAPSGIAAAAAEDSADAASPDSMASADAPSVEGHQGHGAPGGEDVGFTAQSPSFVAVRWLTFAGMLGVIGALCFRMAVLARVIRHAPSESAAFVTAAVPRVRIAAALAALVLLAAIALRLGAQLRAVFGDAAVDASALRPLLTGTAWGWGWLLQAAAALVALGALALARHRPVAPADAIGSAAIVALALSAALSGHPAAADPAALAIGLDAAHVVAVGGWLGTLFFVVAAGVPAALSLAPGARARAVRDLVVSFSAFALVCVPVIALTGVGSAWLEMRSLEALWQTPYGRTLLVKLGAVAAVAAVGAYNWRIVTPRLLEDGGAARIRRSATLELLFAALVLVITAVLVATPPPADMVESADGDIVVTP